MLMHVVNRIQNNNKRIKGSSDWKYVKNRSNIFSHRYELKFNLTFDRLDDKINLIESYRLFSLI